MEHFCYSSCLLQVDFVGLFSYMFQDAQVTPDTKVVVLEQLYINKTTAWIDALPANNKSR
jgi:hypothetical protein